MLYPGRNQPTISFQMSDAIGHRTHGYDTWEATNSGFWPSKPPQNFRNCRSWNDMEVQLGTESKEVDDSGICSPPLWTRSPPRSPHHRKNYYRSLSPASRTQAIARGQRELMEMVQNMPESSYELSLKDLVEHPRIDAREENMAGEKNLNKKKVYKRESNSRNVNKNGQVKRSGNIDSGGFYLKMVFPTSLGSKKKKKEKNESLANNSSKVSPRPSVTDGSVKGVVDKEWWKKSLSVSGGSDSGISSTNSGSTKSSGSSSSSRSSRSNSRHERAAGSCWPFIRRLESLIQK